jgi:hypothetical protein
MKRKKQIALSMVLLAGIAYAGEWYEGGSLHRSTIDDWADSSLRNQLATSADFVAATKSVSSMSQLRRRAEKVQGCISEVASEPASSNQRVSEVAAACVVLLGYR